jgi:hypothetical protein
MRPRDGNSGAIHRAFPDTRAASSSAKTSSPGRTPSVFRDPGGTGSRRVGARCKFEMTHDQTAILASDGLERSSLSQLVGLQTNRRWRKRYCSRTPSRSAAIVVLDATEHWKRRLRWPCPIIELHVLADHAQHMSLREKHEVIERFAPQVGVESSRNAFALGAP